MNTTQLETVWAPRLLSILRIVAALIFMAHGTQKLLGFPVSPNPGPAVLSLPWIAGVLEILGERSWFLACSCVRSPSFSRV
jgi:putative oxidoreductase